MTSRGTMHDLVLLVTFALERSFGAIETHRLVLVTFFLALPARPSTASVPGHTRVVVYSHATGFGAMSEGTLLMLTWSVICALRRRLGAVQRHTVS